MEREKIICEHCGAESAPNMHKRWHGQNCKSKPSENRCHVNDVVKLPSNENVKGLLPKGEKKMSTFVEVVSADKGCQVIINLDHVVEITPLAVGGCVLTMFGEGTKYEIKVKDDYGQFRQFAMQTVSSEDIERQIQRMIPDITRM